MASGTTKGIQGHPGWLALTFSRPFCRPAAILFHSIKPTGELERKSLHTACPVIKGIKWSAAKWVHVGHYATGGERAVALEQKVQDIPKAPSPDGEQP